MKAVQSRLKLLGFGIPLFFVCATVVIFMVDLARRPPDAIPSRNIPEAFALSSPLCQTGFWIKQRVDDRDRNGIIIKSRWVFGCAKGRIVYGRKV